MLGLLLWKIKKELQLLEIFTQEILEESNRKPKKIWVDKGSKFYDRSMKSWLKKKYAIEMYSIHNEGKSDVPESFVRALKNKVYMHMT